ncbi:MAG: PD40 domain-containing protein [Acidobacteriota bacterium]|nr:MAG: PD40 domain-containing protein [Acidobacteriota bacterium]
MKKFILFTLLLAATATVSSQTKLLRFPDIHADRVVFSYGGDLWTASAAGGTATRLTAHPGVETFPKFSSDGKWIAFTGQYDGDEQVYVIPSTGGEPRQLTFYPSRGPLAPRWGYDNQVLGWTPDGKVYYRGSRDSWSLPIAKIYTVSPQGGPSEPMPMPEAGSGAFSGDGTKIVYSPLFRDFRPEKRYSGGQANKLYIYDLSSNDVKLVSDAQRATRDPIWLGGTIYYNSDKDGKFNLYSFDVATSRITQITKNRDWDIRWPSSDERSRIVYERDGELEVFDTVSKRATKLNISVPDDGINRRKRQVSVGNRISSFNLSPKGERAVFAARGDIFTVPIEKGGVRNLTRSSEAHDRLPAWSPDGRTIAYISDRSGEEELWFVDQDGTSAPVQMTNGTKGQKYSPIWSADGRRIAFSDKDGKVYVFMVSTKKLDIIADAPNGQIQDYTWSPKGGFLAYSMVSANGLRAIHIWSAEENKTYRVTPEMFFSSNPAWDPSGDHLFFLSSREFAPQISNSEFNYATNRMTGIFALALKADAKNPFGPESDEVAITEERKEGAPAPVPASSPQGPEKIDFDGIETRVAQVPVSSENYNSLSANRGHLIYRTQPPFIYGRQAETQPLLKIYSLKDRRETTILTPAGGYALTSDGNKMLVGGQGGFSMFDANPNAERTRKAVSTAGLATEIDPVKEWEQIFNESWRKYRDWFYASNMHGFDWAKIREDYRKWLPHVAHRADLNYIIAEMSSELTVQHAYVDGGDMNLPPRVRVALLGAQFELDKAANRFKISKIYKGQNEEEIYRSPLTEVGSTAKVGDYIMSINGEDVTGDRDIYSYLRGKADNAVTLMVNGTPSLQGARKVSVRPITSESNLIYLDWVESNRRRVDSLSNGRLGYLHIPDMGAPGIREFIKWYYPQLNKEGLVIDVRANGGGNVSRMIIERLRRKLLGVNYRSYDQEGSTYPDGVFLGPMIAILNENSASDGDIFPYMFREAGLGQLVGKRSWGGVVGITNRGSFIDGGNVSVPESALANAKGEYIIEGYGVDPDIEVENDPKSVIAGRDPQLERAVAEVLKKITTPVRLPRRPADPVRNK